MDTTYTKVRAKRLFSSNIGRLVTEIYRSELVNEIDISISGEQYHRRFSFDTDYMGNPINMYDLGLSLDVNNAYGDVALRWNVRADRLEFLDEKSEIWVTVFEKSEILLFDYIKEIQVDRAEELQQQALEC